MSDVTPILNSIGSGGSELANDLLPLVYDELRRLAAARMSGERAGHTLQATALVHAAWIRLAGPKGELLHWSGRRHFYAAAAEAKRRVLIDHARRKMAAPRDSDWLRITFGDHEAPRSATPPKIIDLNNALDRLAKIDEEKAEVAKLRLFAGLPLMEIASTLDRSHGTIKRRWSYAKAWLSRELKRDDTKAEKNRNN